MQQAHGRTVSGDTAGRLGRSALSLLGLMLACRAATAQPAGAETALSQRALFDSYQMCATLGLPEDFRTVRDAETAAATAVDRCRVERLALAGQYALDNPGTQAMHRFLDGQRQRVVVTLSHWVTASTRGPAPHPLTPISTGASGRVRPARIPVAAHAPRAY